MAKDPFPFVYCSDHALFKGLWDEALVKKFIKYFAFSVIVLWLTISRD